MNYLTPESTLGKRIYQYLETSEGEYVPEQDIIQFAKEKGYIYKQIQTALTEVQSLVDTTKKFNQNKRSYEYRKLVMSESDRQKQNDSFVWFDNLPE